MAFFSQLDPATLQLLQQLQGAGAPAMPLPANPTGSMATLPLIMSMLGTSGGSTNLLSALLSMLGQR
jgi:hypothetical protein